MGKPSKRVKGYYFRLRTAMPKKEDETKKEFRFLDSDDVMGIISRIRNTPLLSRFRKDYIMSFKGDAISGEGVDIPVYDGYECAFFMRKRDAALPKTATVVDDGIMLKELKMGSESYIMETTFLLVNTELAVLLFIVNGNVSNGNSSVTNYLNCFLGTEETRYLEAVPVANIDALSRLNKLNRIQAIDCCVVAPFFRLDDARNISGTSEMFETLAEAGEDDNVRTIKVVYSAKRNKTVPFAVAKKLYRFLTQRADHKEGTSLFRVRGCGENGPEMIDFINNDFLFTMFSDNSARNLDPSEVFGYMYNHFIQNLKYIEESCGKV